MEPETHVFSFCFMVWMGRKMMRHLQMRLEVLPPPAQIGRSTFSKLGFARAENNIRIGKTKCLILNSRFVITLHKMDALPADEIVCLVISKRLKRVAVQNYKTGYDNSAARR
jgi:hypothetical protein